MKWILKVWLRFRYEIKNHNGQVQLIRYRLIKTPFGSLYIHHFLNSDGDRDLHDHPWNFTSFILWGGYWEERLVDRRSLHRGTWWIRRFTLNRKKADEPHRVLLPDHQTTWTLIFVGPRIREWGFYTENGWIGWEAYKPKNL